MSPSLAISVLLIGHLLSSSASFLETMKLGSHEISPIRTLTAPLIGSPATSLGSTYAHLLSEPLVGYLAVAVHSDSLCENPISVYYSLLNKCIRTSLYMANFYVATSANYVRGNFVDSGECQLTYGTDPFIAFDYASCLARITSYVISTPPLVTEIATIR